MRKSDALFGNAYAMRRCRVARHLKDVYLGTKGSDPDVRAQRWESSVRRIRLDPSGGNG